MLTESECRSLDEDGYLALRGLMPPESPVGHVSPDELNGSTQNGSHL